MKTDYRKYVLTPKDRLLYGAAGLGIGAAVAFTFYRSLAVFLVLGPLSAVVFPYLMRNRLSEKRKEKLLSEFVQSLSVFSGYLNAGLSVENAFHETALELEKLLGKRSFMAKEFRQIAGRIAMNESAAGLLLEFAERSDSREIMNFAEVFALAERSGGSLAKIIAKTSGILKEKEAVQSEIRTQTASRRYEQKIMNGMPFGIILYLSAASPGFLDVMYETAAGRIVMTACLLLCIGALLLSERMLRIET